jgi:hypothetical protein
MLYRDGKDRVAESKYDMPRDRTAASEGNCALT